MTVKTKTAERRELEFASVGELRAELDRIEGWQRAGGVRTTGNWSPGGNLEHCAKAWAAPIDGFPAEMKPPGIVKLIAKVLFKKKAISGATAPAGIRLPKQAAPILPSEGVTFEDGLAAFRAQIARTESGERFSQPSPLFDDLSHEEWLALQLGHAQLHLGFLHPATV